MIGVNFYIIGILLVNILFKQAYSWHQTIKFDSEITGKVEKYKMFQSSYLNRDYFSLLSSSRNNFFDVNDKNQILIGARNNLYKLGLPDLNVIDNLVWPSSQIDKNKCLNRTIIINKNECDNYIKLYLKINDDTLKICSTNALNPKCRFYNFEEKSKSPFVTNDFNETSGISYSPLIAYENKYVYNYVNSNGHLYTANSIDLNKYFTSINRLENQDKISTNVDSATWLHRAEFVSSFNTDERVFFVFNEDATIDESSAVMDGEKRIANRLSSISQICLNDNGAPLNSLRNIWTTYLKSRLLCSYDLTKLNNKFAENNYFSNSFKYDTNFKTSSLFYFDEIKSMSELYTTTLNNITKTYFYATFTTEINRITASAVCMFTMDQIMESFHGAYKSKAKRSSSNNNDDQQDIVPPSPRPSECPKKLTYQHLIFSRKNVLMEKEISSEALIVESTTSSRFNSIDVDNNHSNDVLFIGTDNGKILTFVIENNWQETGTNKSKVVYSEKLTLLESENEILNIKIFQKTHLILITQNKVVSIPIQYCGRFNSKCANSSFKLNKTKTTTSLPSTMNFTQLNLSMNVTMSSIKQLASNPYSNNSKQIYIVKDNQITLSMNFFVFLLLIFIFSIFSFVILILSIFRVYNKILKSSKLKEKLFNVSQTMSSNNQVNNHKKKPQFTCVSVNLIDYSESNNSSPCQEASPLSSSQSLNTTTKSSTISSTYNNDNFKQLAKNNSDRANEINKCAIATISKTSNSSSLAYNYNTLSAVPTNNSDLCERIDLHYYLNQNGMEINDYINVKNDAFNIDTLNLNSLNKYYI